MSVSAAAAASAEKGAEKVEKGNVATSLALKSSRECRRTRVWAAFLSDRKKLADPTAFNIEKIEHKGKDVEFILTYFKPLIKAVNE
ncbi:hypothetical protein T492DRAFT_871341 [Pavlovales sp. CCMP2436]|nr:hypothetical protein T492DRAFT_871341 [Pavlovales sp. CCMP2436]